MRPLFSSVSHSREGAAEPGVTSCLNKEGSFKVITGDAAPQGDKPEILLLYPKTGMDFGSTIAPPHALLTVAAPVEQAGFTVAIRDQRVENLDHETLEKLLSEETLCVGISTMTGTQIRNALNLAARVREITKGKVPIVWGGVHPTVLPEQTLENDLVDIVVVGEGEQPFLGLVQAIKEGTPLKEVQGLMIQDEEGRAISTGTPSLLAVEELLPVPWHLVNVENYIHEDMYVKGRKRVLDVGQTSRGCPFKCTFCSSASIRDRKWRRMSAEKSAAMIIDTVKRFNLDGFWLRDDEFYINRNRADEICKKIIESEIDVSFYTSGTRADVFLRATDEQLNNLKKAGIHTLKFGAESGSQRILDLMKKDITLEQTLQANLRCKEMGFTPVFSFMVGYPTETFEEMNETIKFGYRLKAENPNAEMETIGQFTPFAGTPSWDDALQNGLIPPESLEGWIKWLSDEYDLKGIKLPWYSLEERTWIGNITYMSVLVNAIMNVFDSIRSKPLRAVAKLLARPTRAYFDFRLKNYWYRMAPELVLVRFLRHKIFYETEKTIH